MVHLFNRKLLFTAATEAETAKLRQKLSCRKVDYVVKEDGSNFRIYVKKDQYPYAVEAIGC